MNGFSFFNVEMTDGTIVNLHFSGHSVGRSFKREVSIDEIITGFKIDSSFLDILDFKNNEKGVLINYRAGYSLILGMNVKYGINKIDSIDIDIITIWNGTDILHGSNESIVEVK